MSRTLTYALRVRSYELDSFGHVNNAVYLQYLEAARADYMTQVGLRFADFQQWGAVPVVTKATLEYKSFLVADDEVLVHGEVTDLRRARFAINYRMVRALASGRSADDSLVLTARTEFVFVNHDGKPCGVPQAFRRAFQG